MIITDKFVMLNFPKTGSSFARSMLKTVHNYDEGWLNDTLHRAIRRFRYGTLPNRALRRLDSLVNRDMTELIVPKVYGRHVGYQQSQHGRYSQVPVEHRHKTMVSVVRNPFSRYVSAYLYEGWKERYPQLYPDRLKKDVPAFPDLSFSEYYDMIHLYKQETRLLDVAIKIDLGDTTIQFIRFYFREPDRVLGQIDDEYIASGTYRDDMAPVVFLHQENLSEELFQFLLEMGYPEEEIRFINEAERVNVSQRRSDQQLLDDFYTEDLVQTILRRDRLLFELFPEYRR